MSDEYLYIPYKIDKSSYFKNKIIYNKTPIKYCPNKRHKNYCYSNSNIYINKHNTNFTETVETSFGENKDFCIETNPNISSFKNSIHNPKQFSKTNQGQIKKKHYSKLDIGKIEYQFTKLYESKKNPIKPKKSRTNFSKKEFTNEKTLNSNNNNITFKEIKCNDEKNSLNNIYFKKFGDKNMNDNKDLSPNKIYITEPNLIHDLNNNIFRQYKNNNHLKSIKNINNEDLNKSIKRIIYKSPKINNNTIFKKNKTKINKTAELIENKNKIDTIKKNYVQKKINNNNKKPTLYKIYPKNYKISLINTKLTMKDLKTLKYKINKKVNDNYIKKIIKIQSIWRSFYYRKSFSFYLKFSIFKTILYTLFENINKRYFMKLLNNYQKLEENSEKYLDKPNGCLQPNINNNLINNNSNIKENSYPNKKVQVRKCYNSLSNNDCFNKLNSDLNNNQTIIEKLDLNKEDKKTNSKYLISSKNLSLINNKDKIKKICDNESLNITENKSNDSKAVRNNRFKLEKERQNNLSTEIKGKKRKKLKIFIEYDIDDQYKNINMNKNDKLLYEDKNNDLIQINNNVLNSLNFTLKQNIDKIRESLESINQNALISKIKDEENQRVSIINNNNNIKNQNLKLIIEKNQSLLLNNNKENKREVEKKNELQINPKEIKIIKDNNCSLISFRKKNESLNNKKANIGKNAKNHMMKIIFPIRIKTNIIKNVKKNTFYVLINNLKMLTFISHIMNISDKYMNISKKDTFEKMKKMHFLYYKNYYLNQKIKIKITNLFKKYIYFKLKIFLVELNRLIINKI